MASAIWILWVIERERERESERERERERERVSTNFRLTHGRLHFYMLLGLYEHIEMISGNGSGVSISQEHKEAVGLECVKLREIWG